MLQVEARSKVTIKIIKATHSCNTFMFFKKWFRVLSETSTKVKVHHNIVSKIPVPQTQKMNHGDDFFHIVSSSIIQFTKAYNETCRETEHMCPFYQLSMGIINHGWRYNWWVHLPFKELILTAVSPKLTLKPGLHTRFFHGIFAYKGPTKWPSHLNNDNWWTLEHFSIQIWACISWTKWKKIMKNIEGFAQVNEAP